jgi:hypothetical protein
MLLRAELPARADAILEVAVSLMLIMLGGRAERHALRGARSRAAKAHEESHASRGQWRGIGPLAMGMVHRLAGSRALSALVAARLPSPALGLAFVALFGAGLRSVCRLSLASLAFRSADSLRRDGACPRFWGQRVAYRLRWASSGSCRWLPGC